MEYWQRLNAFYKTLILLGLGGFLLLAPEVVPSVMLLIDIGGFELVFAFIIMNAKTLLCYVQDHYLTLRRFHHQILSSALVKPKVFFSHALTCSITLYITGSLLLSLSFSVLLPALIFNGLLV